jgi:hypothetical protein
LEYLFVREIVRPPVGCEDRSIEPFVNILKPGVTSVIEVGERALW